MREIIDVKFRGKRTDNGEWVEGDLTLYSRAISYITVDLIENQVHEVHTDTVGQFTHLKDKNGREIYEGDVVKTRNYNGYVNEVVKFDFGCFYAGFHIGSSTAKTPKLLNSKVVVLGNIYDNPELLGDSK